MTRSPGSSGPKADAISLVLVGVSRLEVRWSRNVLDWVVSSVEGMVTVVVFALEGEELLDDGADVVGDD